MGSVENGQFLEGSLRGQIGLFPAACVQEIRMKNYEDRNHLAPMPNKAKTGNRNNSVVVPRMKKVGTGFEPTFVCRWGEPHTVILHRGQKGFGFVLRGAKADSPLMELEPSERFPALQYLDDVDENGVADRAGLRKGDFILSINSLDVSQLSHEVVVDLIRKAGELVSMTVVGLSRPSNVQTDKSASKPGSPASLTCEQGGTSKGQIQNHFATLPRKHSGSTTGPTVPSPPRRDPNTSLSVGRARAKSMVAALADLDTSQQGIIGASENSSVKSNSVDSIAGKPPLPHHSATTNSSTANGGLQSKTASIRARPASSRITASEVEEIFAHKGLKCRTWNGSYKIYASVAEMKRSKSALKGKENSNLHKDFHSTPDLKCLVLKNSTKTVDNSIKSKSLSQENLNKLIANPRHSWAVARKGEDSWKTEKLPAPPSELELAASTREENGHDTEGSISDPEGQSSTESDGGGQDQATLVAKPKVSVLTDGEYRTIKPLRPVQSKTLPRRASTGCATISPAEQQTIINLVPSGQIIKVDVSKSKEYGTLEVGASNTMSKSQGGVMSSFKPTDNAKLYASPDDLKSIGFRENQSEAALQSTQSGNAGTLKKVRSQSLPPSKDGTKNPDYAEPVGNTCNGADESNNENLNSFKKGYNNNQGQNNGQFDPQRSLQEAKDKLRPVKPVLKSSSSLQSQSDKDKIRIEVKQSPRLARKAEKTVTFQNASEIDSPPETQINAGSMSHSMSFDGIQKLKTSLKPSKSFPNDLDEANDKNSNTAGHESSEAGKYVTNLPVNPDSDSCSEDSSDKTWILKDENGPSSTSTTSDSVQTVISTSNTAAKTTNVEEKISNLTHQEQTQPKKPMSASAQLGITLNFEQMQQQHQQLYGRLGQQNDPNYGSLRTTARPQVNANLTKNAVSLAKLPPPQETESENEDGKSPKGTLVQKKTSIDSMTSSLHGSAQMFHTLQPQRSRSMLAEQPPQQLQHQYHLQQQQIAARQLQQLQGQMQGQTRQAEKSIEESLKLIQMHVAALKQDFPSVVPPPPEFGLRNQTPILAPPPEFSDARDTHEAATRFNQGQGHMFSPEQAAAQQFNRQSPMYRSISHAHSSTSSMYSGYPTMTRQQYQQQQQLHHLQQQHAVAAAQHQQAMQQQQQHTYGTLQARSQQQQPTYGTTTTSPGQGMLSNQAYNHYQTLTPKSSTGQQQQQTPPVPSTAPPAYGTQQHHPKCYYYQQTPSATTPSTNSNSAKLHPVHRYTPDLYESSAGPRIVGTIPKKPTVADHYEVPHSHQQLIQQQQAAQMQLQLQQQAQQQAQQSNASRLRREFRNKTLQDWTVGDSCDWLDSLFMPEYKVVFQQRGIDGKKLLRMDNATLLDLGVKKLGHRMNIEKSLKRYLPQTKP